MSKEKIKVYKLTMNGSSSYLICQTVKDVLDFLEVEIAENIDEEGCDFKVIPTLMTQKAIDALPEFDGF